MLLTRQWPCSTLKKAFRFISDKPFFLFIPAPTSFSAPHVFDFTRLAYFMGLCAFLVDRFKPGAVLSLRINHPKNVCHVCNTLTRSRYLKSSIIPCYVSAFQITSWFVYEPAANSKHSFSEAYYSFLSSFEERILRFVCFIL